MFVDAFTIQYLQNLRDARKKADGSNRRLRVTPLVSIFAGIVLLICSLVLVAFKSGKFSNMPHMKTPHIAKIPHINMPHVPKMPKVHMPNLKLPNIKLPTFKLSLEDQSRSAYPIIAGHYQIKKLYSTKLVKCAEGRTVTLWQDRSPDGSTVFGSIHGTHVVGSIRTSEMWQKGKKLFTLASYNTNQRGIIQIDPRTALVEKINPGDGCLFVSKCARVAGTWVRDASVQCAGKSKRFAIRQDECIAMIGETKGHVKGNVVFRMNGKNEKEVGRVESQLGVLKFRDHEGCIFSKSLVASEERH